MKYFIIAYWSVREVMEIVGVSADNIKDRCQAVHRKLKLKETFRSYVLYAIGFISI